MRELTGLAVPSVLSEVLDGRSAANLLHSKLVTTFETSRSIMTRAYPETFGIAADGWTGRSVVAESVSF
jgi:hypothetical protein